MENGEWAMGNGEWAMGNGQWAMGNGQWAMGNGLCLLSGIEIFPSGDHRYVRFLSKSLRDKI